MTEQKLYTHTNYIWHLVVLRVIVMSPFAITGLIASFISNTAEKIYWKIDKVLPDAYYQTRVPFDQLSKGEQKEVQRIAKARGAILSQVYDSFETDTRHLAEDHDPLLC